MKDKKSTKEIFPKMKDYQVVSSFLANKGSRRDWNRTAYDLKNCGNNSLILSSTDRIRKMLSFIDRPILTRSVHWAMGPTPISSSQSHWTMRSIGLSRVFGGMQVC